MILKNQTSDVKQNNKLIQRNKKKPKMNVI